MLWCDQRRWVLKYLWCDDVIPSALFFTLFLSWIDEFQIELFVIVIVVGIWLVTPVLIAAQCSNFIVERDVYFKN